MLQGLLYLHKVRHQIHRDMKPGNILINSEGFVKLTDFGIAKTLENTSDLCNTFVGTKTYMSPERIEGKEYSFSSDIWSLGLIVYELATGSFPYKFSKVFIEHIESILMDSEPTLPNDGTFSPELQNFITRCLQKDPKARDSVADLCVIC
jgi:serine/threonine protein kinase